jgi:hypothetical protein
MVSFKTLIYPTICLQNDRTAENMKKLPIRRHAFYRCANLFPVTRMAVLIARRLLENKQLHIYGQINVFNYWKKFIP